jgi:hypothetical protein
LSELRADCARCASLCCVAPAFAVSSDFAIDKPAGVPCPNLLEDFRCGVHDRLRPLGFAGCTVYDCFGAGQRTVQEVYGGRGWRDDGVDAGELFDVFGVLRGLHELAWLLAEVLGLPQAVEVHADARALTSEIDIVGRRSPDEIRSVDLADARARTGAVLRRTSELVRTTPGRDLRGVDLVGRRFGRDDLRTADLSGALLLGADLRGCVLQLTDLLGADLRGCDVSGADLSTALFLTQVQVNAASGDADTALPGRLQRPPHW